MEGDLGTVEAHPAGACEVMASSGAVHCAGASNGVLLVPRACARAFVLGACLHFCSEMPNAFAPCKAASRPPGDAAGEETASRQCAGELRPLVVLDVPMRWRMGQLSARFWASSWLRMC